MIIFQQSLHLYFKLIKKLDDFRYSKKGTVSFNHLATLAEGFAMVKFVTTNTPKSFVDEMRDAAVFYSQKIQIQYKNEGDKGKVHIDFVNQFKKNLRRICSLC